MQVLYCEPWRPKSFSRPSRRAWAIAFLSSYASRQLLAPIFCRGNTDKTYVVQKVHAPGDLLATLSSQITLMKAVNLPKRRHDSKVKLPDKSNLFRARLCHSTRVIGARLQYATLLIFSRHLDKVVVGLRLKVQVLLLLVSHCCLCLCADSVEMTGGNWDDWRYAASRKRKVDR